MTKTIRVMKAEFKMAKSCSVTNITAELHAEKVSEFAGLHPRLFEMLDSMKTTSKVIKLITRHHELQQTSLLV